MSLVQKAHKCMCIATTPWVQRRWGQNKIINPFPSYLFFINSPTLPSLTLFIFSWFSTGSVLISPGSTDGGTSAELDSLFCDPVPTLAMNNAAWEGPTDAPQHVLTERDGRGSTRGRKWGGGGGGWLCSDSWQSHLKPPMCGIQDRHC